MHLDSELEKYFSKLIDMGNIYDIMKVEGSKRHPGSRGPFCCAPAQKRPRFGQRAKCASRPARARGRARAIRRAIRAAAKRAPAGAGAGAQDTRELGSRRRGGPAAPTPPSAMFAAFGAAARRRERRRMERRDLCRRYKAGRTGRYARNPRPKRRLHGRKDLSLCAARIQIMTSHDIPRHSQGRSRGSAGEAGSGN